MSGSRRRSLERKASRNRAAPFRCRLVVMAKIPVAGLAKTRLARELGVGTATRFARHAAAALLARVARHPAWETTLAVTPDSGTASRMWPRGIARMPQGGGDLGRRMQHIVDRTARGPVVIIGTDVPGIRISHIREAFAHLGRRDAVFGPATDGGYWLVGLRRRPRVPQLFGGVRWSSPHALADTLANLGSRATARVATLSDIDTPQDFAHGAADAGCRVEGLRTRRSTGAYSRDSV